MPRFHSQIFYLHCMSTALQASVALHCAAIGLNFSAIFGIPSSHCFRSLSGVTMAVDTNDACFLLKRRQKKITVDTRLDSIQMHKMDFQLVSIQRVFGIATGKWEREGLKELMSWQYQNPTKILQLHFIVYLFFSQFRPICTLCIFTQPTLGPPHLNVKGALPRKC